MKLVRTNEILSKEGDSDKKFFILIKGAIGIFKNDIEITRFCEKGTIIGEMSMLLNSPRTATIKALEDSYIEELSGDIEKLIKLSPEITKNLLINLAERLMNTTESYGTVTEKLHKINTEQKLKDGFRQKEDKMKTFTDYIWFKTAEEIELINISKSLEGMLAQSEIKEGVMHISTIDTESSLLKINETETEVHQLLSRVRDFRRNHLFESRYFLRDIMSICITKGKMDLGNDIGIYYAEFAGRQRKRIVVKIIGI